MKEYEVIRKQDKPDWCGPAVMAHIAGELGEEVNQEDLAFLMGTTHEEGTSQKEMLKGADYLSLNYLAFKNANLDRLGDELKRGRKVVVDFMDGEDYQNDGHYCQLLKVNSAMVLLNDPQGEGYLRAMSRENFERKWFDYEKDKRIVRWALVLWK